jgi:hypothetical protein
MLEKFVSHPLLNGMLLDYVVDLKHVKKNHEILSNMKAGITKHFRGQRRSNLVVARETVCIASSSSNGKTRMLQEFWVWINATFDRPWGDKYNWTP